MIAFLCRLYAPVASRIWAALTASHRPTNLSIRFANLCNPAIEHRGDDLADEYLAQILAAEIERCHREQRQPPAGINDLSLRRHTDVSLTWARTGGPTTKTWEG